MTTSLSNSACGLVWLLIDILMLFRLWIWIMSGLRVWRSLIFALVSCTSGWKILIFIQNIIWIRLCFCGMRLNIGWNSRCWVKSLVLHRNWTAFWNTCWVVATCLPSGSHHGGYIDGALGIIHSIAFSSVHDIAVLTVMVLLVICNDTTDSAYRVPRARYFGHLHWAIDPPNPLSSRVDPSLRNGTFSADKGWLPCGNPWSC